MKVKTRSIPKAKERWTVKGFDHEKRGRFDLYKEQAVHEKKKEELRESISTEAHKLQEVSEERDGLKKDNKEIRLRYRRTARSLLMAQRELEESRNAFLEERRGRQALIKEIEAELLNKQRLLGALNSLLALLNIETNRLKGVSSELEKFIARESGVKEQVRKEKKLLTEAQNERLKAITETEEKNKETERRSKSVEEIKEYLVNLSTKLSSQREEIRQATEWINENLEQMGEKYRMEEPPEVKDTKIDKV